MTDTPLTQAKACLEAIKQYFTTPDGDECWDKMEEAQILCKDLVDTLSKRYTDFEEWKKAKIPNAGAVIHAIAQEAWNDALSKQGDESHVAYNKFLDYELDGSQNITRTPAQYNDILAAFKAGRRSATQQPTAIAEQREELMSIREALLGSQEVLGELSRAQVKKLIGHDCYNYYGKVSDAIIRIDRMIGGE